MIVIERPRQEIGQRPPLQPTSLLMDVLGKDPHAVIRERRDPFLAILRSSTIDAETYPEELSALRQLYTFDAQTAEEVREQVLHQNTPIDNITAYYLQRQQLRVQMLGQFGTETQAFIVGLDQTVQQAFQQSPGLYVGLGFEHPFEDGMNHTGVFGNPQRGDYEIRANNHHYEAMRVQVESKIATKGQLEIHATRFGQKAAKVGEYQLAQLIQSPTVLIGAVNTGGKAYKSAFDLLADRVQFVAQATNMPMIDAIRILERLTIDGYKRDNGAEAGTFIVIRMTDEALEDLPSSEHTPLSGDFDAGFMVLDAAFASDLLPARIQTTRGFEALVNILHGESLTQTTDDLRRFAEEVLSNSSRLAATLQRLNIVAQGTSQPTAEELMYILTPLLTTDTFLPYGSLVQAQMAQDGILTQSEMKIVARLGVAIEETQTRGDERAASNFTAALRTYLDQRILRHSEIEQTTDRFEGINAALAGIVSSNLPLLDDQRHALELLARVYGSGEPLTVVDTQFLDAIFPQLYEGGSGLAMYPLIFKDHNRFAVLPWYLRTNINEPETAEQIIRQRGFIYFRAALAVIGITVDDKVFNGITAIEIGQLNGTLTNEEVSQLIANIQESAKNSARIN